MSDQKRVNELDKRIDVLQELCVFVKSADAVVLRTVVDTSEIPEKNREYFYLLDRIINETKKEYYTLLSAQTRDTFDEAEEKPFTEMVEDEFSRANAEKLAKSIEIPSSKPAKDQYKNKCKCLGCGAILESTFRHDFVQCNCENATFTDGGYDYVRRGGVDMSLIKDISEKVEK